ncbi:MAG: HAMP domain-containing histidine kinase [Nitrospirae bacterium]|nr:HAMP domain-containing histidine kinase [Nitrospirota bacterium]
MFHSARLKLTAWYLLIVMLISISFSAVVYRSLTDELDRAAKKLPLAALPGTQVTTPQQRIDPDLATETKSLILFNLFTVNLLIFGSAGGIGYFLAGRTLKPIKEMMDKQNRFIADASHEFRTPLTAMKTSTEVGLRDPNINLDEAKDLLRENLKDIDTLQLLSTSLLRLAQFEKSPTQLNLEPVSLSEAIQLARQRLETSLKEKNITITLKSKDVLFDADKDGIVELFVILFDNSIKYSQKKSAITVFFGKSESFIVIEVKDQGIGIDARDLPHIFDRFYRSDKSRTKWPSPGYGLGLSIARKIVESHRGSIAVKSVPGKGSTFIIRLPIGISGYT